MPGDHWHALGADEVGRRHSVEPEQGLTEAEASSRLHLHGPNQLPTVSGRPEWRRLLDQLTAPLVLTLIACSIVTAVLGEWVDTAVILGVVAVNALVGYLQEGKAEAALAALARMVGSRAIVTRGGQRHDIDAAELVPGDVVWLTAGDRVPADLRLLRSKSLRTAEAALTGESLPVDKHVAQLPTDTALADRRNMAYAGTHVVAGQGRGLVVATGARTETGRIAQLIAEGSALATPLTRRMAKFSRQLLIAILALSALTFGVGLARGEPVVEMFMAAVALAVGAIPEGLPAAITITLAIGVGRMARRRAIIRHLPAVETLGSTTVICSDKTGTLTENQMTVREIWAGDAHYTVTGAGYGHDGAIHLGDSPAVVGRALREVLVAGALCNDAGLHRKSDGWHLSGDPTEAALLTVARKGGLDDNTLRTLQPRLDELPFDSVRQVMATLHRFDESNLVYVKGALERVLPACSAMLDTHGRHRPLEADDIAERADTMARQGLRVLALARRRLAGEETLDEAAIGGELEFLGLVGMIDPPRPRAISAVRACHAAGIRVKMITGDHAETARAIARQLNVAAADARVLSGRDLAALDDPALQAAARDCDVFARVEPEQKLRLVRALQANGEIVAMTGDGVNDAPALRQADIGIAMGLTGTEVAKEAAAMVLTDDNFATIEAAVEEGRGIYDNLVKFVTWTLPTNFGEGLVILAAVFAGVTLPITPLQVLWINMTTAVLLGLTLAFEPAEGGIMRRQPRPPAAAMIDRTLLRRIVLVGLLMLGAAFGLFQWSLAHGHSLAEARTMAMNVFIAIEIGFLFNCRSLIRPFWHLAWTSNPWLWAGIGTMALLQLLMTYLPAMNRAFATAPIAAGHWLQIGAAMVAAAAIVEAEKFFAQKA